MSDDHTRILNYLATHNTMTLATLGEDGPWAAAVFYANGDNFNFFFKTSPSTRHGIDITQTAQIAATIQDDGQEWQSIVGIQAVGSCNQVDTADASCANDLYLEKFSFLQPKDGDKDDPAKQDLVTRLNETPYFCFRPQWIRLIDNSQGFGHKMEIFVGSPDTD